MYNCYQLVYLHVYVCTEVFITYVHAYIHIYLNMKIIWLCFADPSLSDVYEVHTDLSHAELVQSAVKEFSISDDYMFAVKDHVS